MPDTEPIHLYLRLSKYHRDGADAIERQRLDLTRMFEQRGGFTIVGEYVDNDSASRSAARTRRGWTALNRDIDVGVVRNLAFWKLDRTNRVAARTLDWLSECRERGVKLFSFKDSEEELNSVTAGAKLVSGIKALLAEVETDTMSERQLAAKAHLAEAGFHHGGTRPFGWVPGDRETDEYGRTGVRLVPHSVEFPALQDAVKMVLAGDSLSTVGRHWADAYGITTSTGRVVYPATIRRALCSPRMLGYRMRQVPEHTRGVRINLLDYVAHDRNGQPVIAQEAVCDRITWERVQKALTSRVEQRIPWGSNDWLLTGIAFCTGCSNTLSGVEKQWTNKSGKHRATTYRCLANNRRGAGTCENGVSIKQSTIESYVLGYIKQHLTSERVAGARAEENRRAANDDVQAQLDEAREELETLKAQQGAKRYKGKMVGVLLGMIAEAQDRVDALERVTTSTPAHDLAVNDGDELVANWGSMSLAERRQNIRNVIERIDVFGGTAPVQERVQIKPRF